MRQKSVFFILAGALFFLAGCTAGRSLYSRGEELQLAGNLDEAVLKYSEAMRKNPDSYEYRMAFLNTSEKAAQVHMKKADALYDEADFDKALREYLSAQALDPSLQRASQKVQLLTKLRDSDLYLKEGRDFEKNNKPKEAYRSYKQALSIYPDNREAKSAYDRLRQSKRTKMDGFELNLKSNKPITLKFKDAKTRDVFSILSQLSGINFIFDDTVKDQNITIFLENASFQQAMDIITNLSKLGKKVLSESTIILYPRTPDKTKQYDELVVKTMYLTTLEAKKAVNLLRTMLQLKKIYVNEDLNALVIRDTPEMVDVAQKIIDANDIPEAEVLLDIEVMQMTKKDEENFGLLLSRYAVSVAGTSPSNQFLSDTLVNSTTSSGGTGVSTSSPPRPGPAAPASVFLEQIRRLHDGPECHLQFRQEHLQWRGPLESEGQGQKPREDQVQCRFPRPDHYHLDHRHRRRHQRQRPVCGCRGQGQCRADHPAQQ